MSGNGGNGPCRRTVGKAPGNGVAGQRTETFSGNRVPAKTVPGKPGAGTKNFDGRMPYLTHLRQDS
nr:MAG TPA: hypothetical protein [Caudoviricetes sp.]